MERKQLQGTANDMTEYGDEEPMTSSSRIRIQNMVASRAGVDIIEETNTEPSNIEEFEAKERNGT